MLNAPRTLILATVLGLAVVWSGPSLADHNGVFDVAALQDTRGKAPVAAEDSHWLARVQSWLHQVVTGRPRPAEAPAHR